MKVAFCTGCDYGHDGIADYGRSLAAGLSADGVDVRVLPLEFYRQDRRYYRQLAEQANQADLCHVQYNYVYFNGDLPYRNRFNYFAGRLKVPLVVTVHEVRIGYSRSYGSGLPPVKRILFEASRPLWNIWSRSYHRKAYGRMDRILVHTRGQAERIGRLFAVAQKITVVPHGIAEADARYPGIDPAAARRQLGLEGKTVLAVFGFINKRKGYETALEALARLDDSLVLLIAGGPMTDNETDRDYLRALKGSIEEKKLEKRVLITGHLEKEKIPLVMAAADLCLAPFDSDAASGALSLYVSYGKPVIASDIPANREINSRISCLALFVQGDSRGLEAHIRRCLSDAAFRDQLRAAAAAYAQQYGFRAIAGQIHEIYRSVVAEGGNDVVTGFHR